ncbi:MAG: hypothetical protein ROR55_16650 [Devosia sp.]
MSTGKVIITLIIIAVLIAGGAYFTGYFDEPVVEVETDTDSDATPAAN